jgi:hypothetical protein
VSIKFKVIDNNKKYLLFRKELKLLEKSRVKIGYPVSKNPYKDGQDVAMIAIYNEFGTEVDGKERIPARPFFSNAFDKNRKELDKLKAKLIGKIYELHLGVSQALDILGVFMVGKIRKEITELRQPPNAPSTKKRKKGVDNPLIDTGHLKGSTTYIKEIR